MLKNVLFFVLICFVSMSFFGCAGKKAVVKPFTNSQTYEQSFDETWTKLVRYMSTNQIGVATIEKDSGLIAIKNEQLSKSLLEKYCAVDPPFMTATQSGSAVGSIIASEDEGFTTVAVNIGFQGKYVYGNNVQINGCDSLGVFETQLLDSLK